MGYGSCPRDASFARSVVREMPNNWLATTWWPQQRTDTQKMLEHLIRKVVGRKRLFKPRVLVCASGMGIYPSSGEVIDIASRKVVATLEDEKGRHVETEKLLQPRIGDDLPSGILEPANSRHPAAH